MIHIGKCTIIYDTDIRESFNIQGEISHTTDTIRHVLYFIYTIYDTTRLYARFVLQVSRSLNTYERESNIGFLNNLSVCLGINLKLKWKSKKSERKLRINH